MTRSAAVHINLHGGPDVLRLVQVDVPPPLPGEVQIRQNAIGLNFADIYERKGAHGPHAAKPFPITLGSHGAGVVTALGAGVSHLKVGQPVAYLQPGAYQVTRNVQASRALPLPEGFSEEIAGGNLLRGLTAQYLLCQLYPVQSGDAVLIHAAAGGMGVILSQWARALGAFVIGTVGSEAKATVALAHGCHHVINYRHEDFAARVLELTDGTGVAVVYDAVGKDVFLPSLACLKPRGMAINYGTASGDVEAFDLQLLHAKSLSVSRPTLRTFVAEPTDLQRSFAVLCEAVDSGAVQLEVKHRYPLAEIQRAHHDLENRATSGAPVLIP